jgi:hypothetical protein
MFNPYTKQSDALERFRIKAHLRSYVKDPIIIDEQLLMEAVAKLKKLPYGFKDPADTVAIELVLDAYHLGYFKYEDLTDSGCRLVRHNKHRRHRQLAIDRTSKGRSLRNRYTLKTI